jgi:hypothetical protein
LGITFTKEELENLNEEFKIGAQKANVIRLHFWLGPLRNLLDLQLK